MTQGALNPTAPHPHGIAYLQTSCYMGMWLSGLQNLTTMGQNPTQPQKSICDHGQGFPSVPPWWNKDNHIASKGGCDD